MARIPYDRRGGEPWPGADLKDRYRVADWPVPRGRRAADDSWPWTLQTRPAETFGSDLEAAAITQLRAAVAVLAEARASAGLKLRSLATSTGLALSALTGMEQGSAWPHFATLAVVADMFWLRVQLATPMPVPVTGDRWMDPAGELAYWQHNGHPAVGWHRVIVEQIRRRLPADDGHGRSLADSAGLNRETIRHARQPLEPELGRMASLRTLTVLTVLTQTRIEVVPQAQAWPV